MMKSRKGIFLFVLIFLMTIAADGFARRAHITAEQKALLKKIQTVHVNVLALTEDGRAPSDELVTVVKSRLEELEYTVVTDRNQPHDVRFRVKCEERKRWTGTTNRGGDAELADAPARLWEGPACLFSYRIQGQDLGWYKEVRTDFSNAMDAAQKANVSDAGAYALSQLKIKMQEFDFPILITTEWQQIPRFLPFLRDPKTSNATKLRILTILSKHQTPEALPYLKELIDDEEYTEPAILALGGLGRPSVPILANLLRNHPSSKVKAAAAKGLGIVAASTGDPATNEPLLEYLLAALENMNSSEDIDFPVLTEVVWAIGKLRNDMYVEPIEELNVKIWLIRDTSREMKELRDAANVATKMIDLDYQIM